MGKGVKAICRIKNVRVTEMSGYSHLHGTGPFVGQQTIVLKKYQEFSFSGNSLRRRGGGTQQDSLNLVSTISVLYREIAEART